MEILKFGDSPTPKRSNNNGRKPAAMVVAGLLVAMMGMSTTLAGTITMNANSNVEFGQGMVTTAACDSSIKLTPTSVFDATVGTETFTVRSILLENINGATYPTGESSCAGKYFTIRAYSGSTALTFSTGSSLAGSSSYIKVKIPSSGGDTSGNWTTFDPSTNAIAVGDGSTSYAGSTSVAPSGWTADLGKVQLINLSVPNSVTRFTIESSDS